MHTRVTPGRAIVLALTTFACAATVAALSPHVRAQRGSASPPPPAARSRGRQVYEKHCVECHGESGRGDLN